MDAATMTSQSNHIRLDSLLGDQCASLEPIARELERIRSARATHKHPANHRDRAARKWADGWRGGLSPHCEFDRGFHAGRDSHLATELSADACS